MVNVMQKHAGFMKALKCRECGREYPLTANHVCEFDFGPLEVVYDYERIKLTTDQRRHPIPPKKHVALSRIAAHRRAIRRWGWKWAARR